MKTIAPAIPSAPIVLSDEVLALAAHAATERGISLTEFMNLAVTTTLEEPDEFQKGRIFDHIEAETKLEDIRVITGELTGDDEEQMQQLLTVVRRGQVASDLVDMLEAD